MQIFISYSSHDLPTVKVLATNLENALSMSMTATNHTVWFDQDLVGGQDWWDAILSNIRSSDFVVYAMSPKSIVSDPCSRELTYAEALHRQILPVLITRDPIEDMDLPDPVAHIQYIDFSEPDKTESFLKLFAAVKKLVDAVEPLPESLPDPPPIPIPPLTDISHKLREATLSREEQLDMYDRLHTALSDPDQAKDARDLLMRLQKHNDVRAAIRDDIAQLLKNTPESKRQSATVTPAPVSQPAKPSFDPINAPSIAPPSAPATPKAKSRWLNLNGRTIGLIVGVLLGYVLALPEFACELDPAYCYGFNDALYIGYIITFTLIGWGIDLLRRRMRGDSQNA